jgi:glycosyltransferase involved in cell wall biosynthesis
MRLPLKHTKVLGVSIVIVTYNGRPRLEATLNHLAKQEGLDFNCELLVIDNNSQDKTAEFVQAYWAQLQSPFPLRLIKEPKAGTMYARQASIAAAHFRYILFCDDDNWLHSKYATTAYALIKQNDRIAAVGGLGLMTYEPGFEVPPWMCEQFERSYGTGSQGKQDGDTTNVKGSLYTAGTIFDRVWLDRLYRLGFKTALKGRDGKSLVAGEDTELTMALKLIGGRLQYSSQLHFKHYMPKERINWRYLKQLWRGFGASNYFVSPYRHVQTNYQGSYIKNLYLALKELMRLHLRSKQLPVREGDVLLLELEMAKGTLRAMLFKQAIYNDCKKTAIHLFEQYPKKTM